ncbi:MULTISPECIES: MarR family winged helix-turn-helix transcriptional regulator [Streptomyces]|uniref:MarR family winged helix-turn-helix transcriptional regulator n=1 Tax=Streptomyces TaxID=1883 RepID=UPI001E55BD1B|nr:MULTISPECIES: MarR family transcriptional regulator [Streptomyces]UFQ19462.1 MarR family transcriptional regulator [Streptomyces huasconensis]WCL89081.1 MarR family transcriptional regulator [Streptomyces sp. JCM 35825]
MPETPDVRPDASHAPLLDALWTSMAGLYGDLTAAAAAQGLTYSQAKALNVLRQSGPAPMRVLAASFRCDASNMTGIIDRLESRGLVRREPSATDRRVKNVVLSEEGVAAIERIRAGMHLTHRALDALSEEERATLQGLLSRLSPDADTAPGASKAP